MHDAVLAEDLPRQVRDRPKEEQDRDGRKQGAHNVNHKSYLRRVACEARKDATRQHKERCAGRVSYVEFRSGGDKLGAIPKARRRLYCKTIGDGSNGECNPTYEVVDQLVLLHSERNYYIEYYFR